jgi:hypothetical protein
MFYMHVVYVCNIFQVFSGVLASVSDACFKYFIYLFCMLQNIWMFQSRSRVAHGMLMRSGRGRERFPGERRPGGAARMGVTQA